MATFRPDLIPTGQRQHPRRLPFTVPATIAGFDFTREPRPATSEAPQVSLESVMAELRAREQQVRAMRPLYSGAKLAGEILRCRASFEHFLRNHVYIAERSIDGQHAGLIKWEWWPAHDRMIADVQQERRLIVVKARQISWSWFLAALNVWDAMFTPHYLGGVVSAGQTEASEFLAKCAFIVQNLPWDPLPVVAKSNTEELRFAGTDGGVLAFPSTASAGRGYTFSRFVADEAAFHRYADQNYAAYSAATEHGQIIIVSSAGDQDKQVVSDWFQRMWQAGRDRLNTFAARFYDWRSRPGRDEAWYEEKRREYSGTPGQLAREYPSSPEEAFRSMLSLRFDVDALHIGRQNVAEPLRELNLPDGLNVPYLSVWSPPRPGIAYCAYTDGASGRGRDYTATGIMETKTLRHVATLRDNRLEPRQHAMLVLKLLRWYNNAFYGFERAEGGEDIVWVMTQAQYHRLYWHQERPATLQQRFAGTTPVQRLGYPMSEATRPVLINVLAQAVVDFAFYSPDVVFWDEASTFIVNEKGKPEAAPGKHDDMVLMMAGLLHMAAQAAAQFVGSTASPAPMLEGGGWRW